MKLVVIESPFKATPTRSVVDNTLYAISAMRHSLSLQEAPFASHLLYTQVLADVVAAERAQGIEAGLAWGRYADMVAVYCDFGISKGMFAGIGAALDRGTWVVYRFRPQLELGVEEFAESLVLPDMYNHPVL